MFASLEFGSQQHTRPHKSCVSTCRTRESMTFFVFMDYGKNLDLADIKYFCEFDQIWKTEEWLILLSYEDKYQISDLGRVKSINYNKTNKPKILRSNINKKGYRTLCLNKDGIEKNVRVHQLVAIAFLNHTPCGLELVVNHKNHNRLDNQKLNLEIITNRENTNRKHLKSTSKFVGVSSQKKNSKWRAQIVVSGKVKHLGMFISEIEAHNSYQEALKLINITNK